MMKQSSRMTLGCAALAAVLGSCPAPAAADPVTYTFDELALNTAVTNQYYGVTFSAQVQSCGGSPFLYMRIKNPTGGTASGTRCLMIDQGCPDFSSDWLRMVFDLAQTDVKFYVGDFAGVYQIRAYSSTSGSSGLLSTQNITLDGTGYVGVHRLVSVHDAAGTIRRVEVQMPIGLFESIDDLTFDPDPTPPEAAITSPTEWQCVCGTFTVTGTAYDPDGPFLNRRLEYSANPGGPWTLISSSGTEVASGILGSWNTTALTEGTYYLQLTSTNATEAKTSTIMPCWVSRTFDTVNFSLPAIVSQNAVPDGTVFDSWCGVSSYLVETKPLMGMVWTTVHTGTAERINQNLASWNTNTFADGRYLMRVTGTNPCGQSTSQSVEVIVDNTPPVAEITTPLSCSNASGTSITVRGTATDANMGEWSLWYIGGLVTHWQLINSGNTPVVSGELGTWNIAGTARCAYALRLVVNDAAVRNNNAAIHNSNEYVVGVDLGCAADFNRDGLESVSDIFDFLNDWFAGCP